MGTTTDVNLQDASAPDTPPNGSSAPDTNATASDATGTADATATPAAGDTSQSAPDATSARDSSGASADNSGQSSGSAGSKDSQQTAQSDNPPAGDLTADPGASAQTVADSSAGATSSPQAADATSNQAEMAAEGGVGVKELIELGTAAADIMKASAPDYSMKSDPVSLLPKDATSMDLSGFSSSPQELKVRPVFKNGLGMLKADLPLVVQWHYGGQYKGHGRYINGASVFVDSGADIGAFYKVDIHATLGSPQKAGSDTEPVATLDAHIDVTITDKISPSFNHMILEGQIRGDGSGELKARPS